MKSSIQSLLSSFAPDIAIRPNESLCLPHCTVVIDYNMARLRAGRRTRAEFREVSPLDGLCKRVLLGTHLFEPLEQLRHDLRVLIDTGNPELRCALIVQEKKLLKRLTRLMQEVFATVDCHRCGSSALIIGSAPIIECQVFASKEHLTNEHKIQILDQVQMREYRLATWHGLFSGDVLDQGTSILIDALPHLYGLNVLDVGCGCGPLTIIAASRGARVTYADVDARALRVTGNNLARYGLEGTPVGTVDLSEVDERSIDIVLSNPPTHAGSNVLRALFDGMLRVLKPGGQTIIVIREHLNYEKWLAPLGTIEQLVRTQGYKVLSVTKQ